MKLRRKTSLSACSNERSNPKLPSCLELCLQVARFSIFPTTRAPPISVPEVLIGGNHAEVTKWRRQQALEKTRRNRPDLLPSE